MFSNVLLIQVPCLITSFTRKLNRQFILRLFFQFAIDSSALPNYLITLKSKGQFILRLVFQFTIDSSTLPNYLITRWNQRDNSLKNFFFQFFVGWTDLPNYIITLKSKGQFILRLVIQFSIDSSALPNYLITRWNQRDNSPKLFFFNFSLVELTCPITSLHWNQRNNLF